MYFRRHRECRLIGYGAELSSVTARLRRKFLRRWRSIGVKSPCCAQIDTHLPRTPRPPSRTVPACDLRIFPSITSEIALARPLSQFCCTVQR